MTNINQLRTFLSNNLEKIEKGEIPLQKALELCRTSQVIINSLKLEIEYHKLIKSKDKIKYLENE